MMIQMKTNSMIEKLERIKDRRSIIILLCSKLVKLISPHINLTKATGVYYNHE